MHVEYIDCAQSDKMIAVLDNAFRRMRQEEIGFIYLGWCKNGDERDDGEKRSKIRYGCEHAYAITRLAARVLLQHTSSCAGSMTSQLHSLFNRGLVKYAAVQGMFID